MCLNKKIWKRRPIQVLVHIRIINKPRNFLPVNIYVHCNTNSLYTQHNWFILFCTTWIDVHVQIKINRVINLAPVTRRNSRAKMHFLKQLPRKYCLLTKLFNYCHRTRHVKFNRPLTIYDQNKNTSEVGSDKVQRESFFLISACLNGSQDL